MWKEIVNENDVTEFLETVCYFHDSCIKEMKYISGASVSDNLSMYPLNDRRILNVIIQRQFDDFSMIELEFQGLKYLKLFPVDGQYTCEILDATLILKGGYVYWCDCGGLSETDLDNYEGTLICASKLRWRAIDGCMGKDEFYVAVK